MKPYFRLSVSALAAAVALLSAASCNRKPVAIDCMPVSYADTTENLNLSIDLELPVAARGPARTVRDTLLTVFIDQLESFGYSEDYAPVLDPYKGDRKDIQAQVAHYGSQISHYLDSLAAEDRSAFLVYSEFAPSWDYSADMTKIAETDSYVVFNSSNYVYMGGAHGGITGAGDLTFRKSDGRIVRVIIDRDRVGEMQDIIREGLESFIADGGGVREDIDFVFTEGGIFPLPVWEPALSEDGVVFLYQQYEIAPYAFGMPTFTVPYEEMMEFLTPEARDLVLSD